MVKHTQTIRQQIETNCLSVFDHFVELALKGLSETHSIAELLKIHHLHIEHDKYL